MSLKFMSNKTHIFSYSKYHTNSVAHIHEILGDICRRWAKSFHQEIESNIRISLNTLVQKVFEHLAWFPCWQQGLLKWAMSVLVHQLTDRRHWALVVLTIISAWYNGELSLQAATGEIFDFFGGGHLYWIVFSLRREEAWAKGQIRDRICSNEAGTCSELLLRRNFDCENYYKFSHPLNLPPPQPPGPAPAGPGPPPGPPPPPSITIAITPHLCPPPHSVTITVSDDPAHHCVK